MKAEVFCFKGDLCNQVKSAVLQQKLKQINTHLEINIIYVAKYNMK